VSGISSRRERVEGWDRERERAREWERERERERERDEIELTTSATER